MSVKEEENNIQVLGIIDNDEDDLGNMIEEYNQKFKIIWLLHIYPCLKIDSFGAKIYPVTYFFKPVDHRCFGLFHLYFCMLNPCGILFCSHKYEEVNSKDTS